jgi:hypothetical protein
MELAGLLSSVTGLTGKAFSGNGVEAAAREPKPQDAPSTPLAAPAPTLPGGP